MNDFKNLRLVLKKNKEWSWTITKAVKQGPFSIIKFKQTWLSESQYINHSIIHMILMTNKILI